MTPADGDRAGVLRRLKWRLRGWPRALPLDLTTAFRVESDLMRTSIATQASTRLADSGLQSPAARSTGVVLLTIIPSGILLPLGIWTSGSSSGPLAFALIALAFLMQIGTLVLRFTNAGDPTFRAGLRRQGIDCCVRCGHLMETDRPDASCPECGLSHEHLPLGWEPPPKAAAAARPPEA